MVCAEILTRNTTFVFCRLKNELKVDLKHLKILLFGALFLLRVCSSINERKLYSYSYIYISIYRGNSVLCESVTPIINTEGLGSWRCTRI